MAEIVKGRIPVVCVILFIFLNACAYNQYAFSPEERPYDKPEISELICTMFPPNPEPGAKVYFPDKHANPATAVGESIFQIVQAERPSSILLKTSDENSAIEQCASKGGSYVLSPRITAWRGRASIWTLKVNFVSIEIRLLKVKPVMTARSARFQASDGWFNSGEYDPANLLTFNDSWKQTIIGLIRN